MIKAACYHFGTKSGKALTQYVNTKNLNINATGRFMLLINIFITLTKLKICINMYLMQTDAT